MGIILIIIPYTIGYDQMQEYIVRQCAINNIYVIDHTNFDYRDFDISYSKNKLIELNNVARSRGGGCLSITYINSLTKLKWKCEYGHTWKATSIQIKRGNWCPICANKSRNDWKRLTIEGIRKLAKKMGGNCLSEEYLDANTKLKWQCGECGKVWESLYSNVKLGHWCPKCGIELMLLARSKRNSKNARLTIENMKKIAEERNGKCLSTKYKNNNTKLKWTCNVCNNTWHAIPSNIKAGSWCPVCSRKNAWRKRKQFTREQKLALINSYTHQQ